MAGPPQLPNEFLCHSDVDTEVMKLTVGYIDISVPKCKFMGYNI